MDIVECVPTARTRAAVAAGRRAHRAATEEHGPSDEWDRRVIDRAIRAFVRQGQPFSANDLRPLLPVVRKCLISRRLIEAQRTELITWTGRVTPSTLPSTKAARVNVYQPHPEALDAAA
jgi:hypothetical protein